MSFGMIITPSIAASMLLGTILGWGVLSPIAKARGWVPGPVDSFENGVRGWTVWVSLGLLLGDSVVSIGWLAIRPLAIQATYFWSRRRFRIIARWSKQLYTPVPTFQESQAISRHRRDSPRQSIVVENEMSSADTLTPSSTPGLLDTSIEDFPKQKLISKAIVCYWLVGSLALYLVSMQLTFNSMIPLDISVLAIPVAFGLSPVTMRTVGETSTSSATSLSQ